MNTLLTDAHTHTPGPCAALFVFGALAGETEQNGLWFASHVGAHHGFMNLGMHCKNVIMDSSQLAKLDAPLSMQAALSSL